MHGLTLPTRWRFACAALECLERLEDMTNPEQATAQRHDTVRVLRHWIDIANGKVAGY